MSLRMLPLLIALALSLAPSSQAALFVTAPPASSPPSTPENACTAFLPNESESRIGLLVGNDPLDKTDPMGLDVELRIDGVYFGNSAVASEFAGGSERGHMASAYSPRGQIIQVNANRSEAALPARLPKAVRENGVQVANPSNARQTSAKVTDVGPHNTTDKYWDANRRPAAERQHAEGTKAQNGKVPTNPAGIDLTPQAMKELGVKGPENSRQAPVVWWFKGEAFSGYTPFVKIPEKSSQ